MIRDGFPSNSPEGQSSAERPPIAPSPLLVILKGEGLHDPAAPAANYIREQLAVLCGDEYPVVPLYVRGGEELNASAADEVMAVEGGTFERLEFSEEMYGLLAHELGHIVKGHRCKRQEISAEDAYGLIRTQELEVDVWGMHLLDRRGINPMGMISLMDKLQKAAERPAEDRAARTRSPRIHSPTHGDSLERKITLKQLLTILDLKHLSPHMHTLEAGAVGDKITIDDQRFWSLPAPLQQALLNTTIEDNHIHVHHVRIQEAILRSVSEQPNEEDLRIKALALLGIQYTIPERLGRKSSLAHLQYELSILDSDDVRLLMTDLARADTANRLLNRHLQDMIFNDAGTMDDILQVAEITKKRAITFTSKNTHQELEEGIMDGVSDPFHSLLTFENLVTLDRLRQTDPGRHNAIINKMARFGAATITQHEVLRTAYMVLKGKMQEKQEAGEATPSLTSIEKTIILVDSQRMAEAQQCPTLTDKIRFVLKHSSDDMQGFLSWGLGQDLTVEGEFRIGPFAQALVHEVRKQDTATLHNIILELADAGETITTVGKAAELLWSLEYGIMMPVKSRFDNENESWREELLFLFMGAQVERDTLRVALPDFGINERPAAITEENDLPDLSSEDASPFSLDAAVDNMLWRMEQVEALEHRLRAAYPELIEYGLHDAIKANPALKEALSYDALRSIVDGQQDTGILVDLMQRYGVRRLQVGALYPEDLSLEKARSLWCQAIEVVLNKPDWQENEADLLAMAALGMAAPEIELNLTVADFAFEKLTRMRDFDGGMRLFDEFPQLRTVHGAIFTVLVEEKARTVEDFERLNVIAESLYADTLADNYGALSAATLADSVAIPLYSQHKEYRRSVGIKNDTVSGMESSRLLAALLSSGQNDQALKHYVAERWWLAKRTILGRASEELVEHFKVEDYLFHRHPGKAARLNHWLQHDYPKPGSYTPFDNNMSHLYLLTSPARFMSVRKLLLAEGDGVLKSAQGAQDLVDALMMSWLAAEEGTEEGVMLRDLLHDLITENDAATSYLHIGPMLQEMILKPPKASSDLEHVTQAVADNIVQALVDNGQLQNPTERDRNAIYIRVHRLFLGQGQKLKATDEVLNMKTRILDAIGVVDTEPAGTKLSTPAFAALAGKKSGSLGVKMLQLAGQYFDLSPEDRAEFEEVYDDMKGQTRLQAYNVLKREAQEKPAVAALLDSIVEFGPRIGGGSLFTVYNVRLADGSEKAIGVKNPNAEYRVAQLADFTSTGLEKTAQKHPGNSTVQLIASLLDDAAQWIRNELHDPDFHHKDAVFKAENDTLAGNGFQKGTSRYHLTTPEASYTGSEWIRAEAFIKGKNLNGLRISDSQSTDIPQGIIHRDDYRHAASLLVRNYVYQVMRSPYAHSDIHPGNFRITADNSQVVIFDRHNLIPVHDRLRQTLRQTFTAIMSNDVPAAALAIATYSTPDLTSASRLQEMVQAIAAQSDNPTTLVTDTILALKREGISVPLELSLILRNFMSIAQLSQEAGFSNVGEAFMHTSTGLDELTQLL